MVRAADSPFDRVLHEVRVYRGLPSPTRQPKGYAAARAQISVWQQLPKVKVVTRPLQYPDNWPAEKANEKGVDVQLALDMALMAHKRAYEVGILMSLDTDLKPILESVADLTRAWGKPRAEAAAYSAAGQRCGRLPLPGQRVYCHWIDEAVYKSLRDDTDYT
ncbi:MAG TPA: NYN domain-containing protein [Mycobacterium sp.]|nr:NYN domain-containing protein [Mycobacterium sp.]